MTTPYRPYETHKQAIAYGPSSAAILLMRRPDNQGWHGAIEWNDERIWMEPMPHSDRTERAWLEVESWAMRTITLMAQHQPAFRQD
ncbi:hypothetical protein [Kushneria indalinina]|uniref:Uncharacterized protein n=1 Tax=Kushneria indalinina DSM 14324 TaxID=1122140 RepID=A0A3D9DVQ6_9GAMM|nr:hypothetical protein [Kushneria indalinina]REC94860.1 hypothetical protein C8D72_1689 [Kushneria indalinina DSM 14324]